MFVHRKRKRVELLVFERERIIRPAASPACPVCNGNHELLTTRQAATLAQVRTSSIYRWVALGELHGIRTPGGQYRICKNSLFGSRAF